MQIFLIRVKLCHCEVRHRERFAHTAILQLLIWRDNVFLFAQIKLYFWMSVQKLPHKCVVFCCCFVCFNIDWSDVCVFACRNRMHHHIRDCLCGTGRPFSKYPETPQELPRAERTASVCVLVPSKQGNLENTKGAANKHNLIPPSSYTWRWILQHYSEDACLHVCASICMCER